MTGGGATSFDAAPAAPTPCTRAAGLCPGPTEPHMQHKGAAPVALPTSRPPPLWDGPSSTSASSHMFLLIYSECNLKVNKKALGGRSRRRLSASSKACRVD